MNTFLRMTLLSTICVANITLLGSPTQEPKQSAVTSFDALIQDKDVKSTFKQLIKGEKPVILKVIKAYCPHCKGIKEPFEEIAQKYEGNAFFIEVDAMQFPSIVREHAIGLVPTFIIYNKGKKVDQFKRGLIGNIEKYLNKLGVKPVTKESTESQQTE